MNYLLDGWLKIRQKRENFQILRKDHLVTEAVSFLYSHANTSAYTKANEDSSLITIPRKNLLSICQESNEFCLRMLTVLSFRLYQNMNRRIALGKICILYHRYPVL